MPELEIKVEVIKIEYLCDVCKEGVMLFKNVNDLELLLMVGKEIFNHVCSKCGYEQKLKEQYPKLEYRPII